MKLTARTTGIAETRAELQRIGALPAKTLAVVADEVETFVEGEAAKHSKTGAIVSSIYLRRDGSDFTVGHDGQRAPEALFLHWGSRAHVIRPKNKKVLRWAGNGLFHFAKKVNHPGYRGDPWMVRAATMAPRLFEQHLQAMLARDQGT